MGKTTLISLVYLYLTTSGRKITGVPIFQPSNQIEEILQTVLRGLGFSVSGESKASLLSRLDEDLAQRSARGETVAFIFDEAHNLKKETLDEICLLANPSSQRPGLLQEIFVANPQFEKKLSSGDLSFLDRRFGVRCRLQPFTAEESRQYIEHRLSKAGSTTSKVFSPRAVSLITQTSKGNPRTINWICGEALSVGYSQMTEKIESANVREALANLGMKKQAGWPLPWKTRSWIEKSLGRS